MAINRATREAPPLVLEPAGAGAPITVRDVVQWVAAGVVGNAAWAPVVLAYKKLKARDAKVEFAHVEMDAATELMNQAIRKAVCDRAQNLGLTVDPGQLTVTSWTESMGTVRATMRAAGMTADVVAPLEDPDELLRVTVRRR